MRALLVCASPVVGSSSLLARLAEDADLVVAVDGGGSLCLEAGIVPDMVLGDFDSLPAIDLQRLRTSGAEVLEFPAEKDASDLELAVAEARSQGATSVVVTAASSGRPDHYLAVLGVLASARDLRPTIVEPEAEMWLLSVEGRASLVLSGADATISLIPFGGSAVVSARGVQWELKDAILKADSSTGLSNRIDSKGLARICVATGIVLVFLPHATGAVSAQGS